MNPESPNARSSRQSAGLQSVINLVLAAVILVLINYLGFKYYDHKDLSASQYYTLSEKTKDVLTKLDSPLHVYTFLDPRNEQQNEQIEKLLQEYVNAEKKYVSYEKIDPAYDPKRAKELYDQLHFDGNDHLIIITYKEKEGRSPRFVKQDDLFEVNPMTGQTGGFKGEQQITGSIVALVEGKAPKVYFTEGHGEHNINDLNTVAGYGGVAALLKNDNVQTAMLNLAQQGEVPADADAVVIAGPSIPLAPIEATALDKYLASNGKLFILLDPYYNSGLDLVLAKYGIKYEDDLALRRVASPTGAEVTLPLAAIYQGGFSAQPITTKFAQAGLQLVIQDARSLTLPPPGGTAAAKIQFLLQTDADTWGWVSKIGGPPADPKTLTYNKVTDIGGPLTIAAQFDGGTTTDPTTKATMFATRIVAVGSSKFLENDAAEQVGANFFTNVIDWLVKKDAVLDIAPKPPTEYGVFLSPMSFSALIWTATIVIPGAALILGAMIWFSRRK